MGFVDDTLAQNRRRDRDPSLLCEPDDLVLQPESMDLHPGDDQRFFGGVQTSDRLADRFVQGLGVEGVDRRSIRFGYRRDLVDHIPRQIDIDRTFVAVASIEHAIDLAKGRRGIIQLGRCNTELLENLELRAEVADLVMKQWIVDPLLQTRRAGQHHHRRFFGKCTRDAVAHG